MPIQFPCPTCGKSLKAPEATAGKMAKCPYCLNPIRVPEELAPESVFEAEEVSQPPEGPVYSMQASPEGATNDEGARRPCPMCGEMIKVDAVKCRFCGEIFDETLKRAAKKKRGGSADLTTGDILLAILCSGIGCLFGIGWLIQGKSKGAKMIGLSFLFWLLWYAILTALGTFKDGR